MVADGLLTRQRYREVPPRVDYELTERARDLLPVISALSRWGSQWAWSPPRGDEAVDIGAIFRSVPGLALPTKMSGTIELQVERPDGQLKRYVLRVARGRVSYEERSEPGADARVSGTQDAWIAALGPDQSRGSLEMTGDATLAGTLLDALSPVAVAEAKVA